jgi:hypothetical protein
MKQTATNYLIEQLSLKTMAEHMPWVAKILDTAIEMEHEQIIESQIEIVKSIVNQGNNNPYGILKKTLIELHKEYNEIRARNL